MKFLYKTLTSSARIHMESKITSNCNSQVLYEVVEKRLVLHVSIMYYVGLHVPLIQRRSYCDILF